MEKEYLAKTFHGLEEVLANELKAIGGKNIEIHRRGVSFWGNKEVLYKANFHSRTATRILMPLKTFTARNEDELYGLSKQFDWSEYMDLSQKFVVDSTVNSSTFTHSHFAALRVKDAIADFFRDKYGRRPFVDPTNPQIRIHIHIAEQECTLLLDSSGESLHKRGYRIHQSTANLNEILAAGLILLSGWDGTTPFIDPMCGSGTLLIEAALIATGMAPGLFRKQFAFENWLDFDSQLFEAIFHDESMERDITPEIIGGDVSRRAVEITATNLKSAGVQKLVKLSNLSIFDFDPPEGPGVVITNPPYGERLKKEQITTFYKQLGDTFKQRYEGYDIYMLSGNMEAVKNFGLRATNVANLYNGPIECKYQHYSIYSGSKKQKHNK